jgi:hypothetical protein
MSKWSFAVYNLLRFIGQVVILSLLFGFVLNAMAFIDTGQILSLKGAVSAIVMNPFYQTMFLILFFIHGRTVLFRLDDKEV